MPETLTIRVRLAFVRIGTAVARAARIIRSSASASTVRPARSPIRRRAARASGPAGARASGTAVRRSASRCSFRRRVTRRQPQHLIAGKCQDKSRQKPATGTHEHCEQDVTACDRVRRRERTFDRSMNAHPTTRILKDPPRELRACGFLVEPGTRRQTVGAVRRRVAPDRRGQRSARFSRAARVARPGRRTRYEPQPICSRFRRCRPTGTMASIRPASLRIASLPSGAALRKTTTRTEASAARATR